jgi:hypothetical protein
MSFTDLVMEYSAFLQTTKEGERVLPIWLFCDYYLSNA